MGRFTLAAVLVAAAGALPAGVGGGDKQDDTKAAAPKIHGRCTFEVYLKTLVIKSVEQLSLVTPSNGSGVQITADLAQRLKVSAIDWKKQMVVVIYGGEQPTGGYNVELKSLDVKDGKLIVRWKLNRPGPDTVVTQARTYPTLVLLVDRFDGDVVFDPLPSKK
jgi:PrcB C-terminal